MSTILSLSGGGVWGLIESRVLERLYPGENGHSILSHFDLAIGTSAGAIVLAGLAADLPPNAITSLFLDPNARAKLFVRDHSLKNRLLSYLGVGPKWSNQAKLAELINVLGPAGSRPIWLSPTPIAFTAFDIDTQREVLFTSCGAYASATLAEAANASSSAPVLYFDAPAEVLGMRLYDGAVSGLNNPVMAGVGEANTLGMTQIKALSIGTGTICRPVGEDPVLNAKPAGLGPLASITAMAESIMDDPPNIACWNAYVATMGHTVCLNPILRPAQTRDGWALPTAYDSIGGSDAFEAIATMDMCAQNQSLIDLLDQWCELWMDDQIPNQAIRGKIGATTFSKAVADWKALCAA